MHSRSIFRDFFAPSNYTINLSLRGELYVVLHLFFLAIDLHKNRLRCDGIGACFMLESKAVLLISENEFDYI